MNKILAIGAHPDDIELGCAGALLKHSALGDEIHILVLTKGEASGNFEIRWNECLTSAKYFNATLRWGGLKDTCIDDGIETVMAIEKVINELQPNIIYTHSHKDTHQDHRNIGYATLSAARRSKKILMFETPTTISDFSPQVYVDIKPFFEKKKEIMRLFTSQSKKDWWAVGTAAALALEGLAAYRGFQAGIEVAEAFELYRLVIAQNERILSNGSGL